VKRPSSPGRRKPGDRPAGPVELPGRRLRVETEAMADGREIHYYSWPDAVPPGPPGGRPARPAEPPDE
jgi:hypothetical protein